MTRAMEERIIELETRLSFQDDLIRQLNDVIVELRGEMAELANRLEVTEGKIKGVSELVKPQSDEEPPPHY